MIIKRSVSCLLAIILSISLSACGSSASTQSELSMAGSLPASAEVAASVGELALLEGIDFTYGIDDHAYDKAAAKECFLQAAEAEIGEAYFYLGLLSLRSSDESRFKKAWDYFNQAADMGCLLGLIGIGSLYENGQGVERDYVKAKEFYEESLEKGCIEANYNYGHLFDYALGVDRDCVLAQEYYKKALESRFYNFQAAATVAIGTLYLNGIGGVQTDYETAIRWFQQGCEKYYGPANVALGQMYQWGFGVERDYQRAMEYYKTAANNGCGDAMCQIGTMYNSGTGVESDWAIAESWYERAAEEGCSDAYYHLGNIYRNRDNDYEKAFEYYDKAINAGNVSAYTCIGYSYYLKKAYSEEIDWYQKGAELGENSCMYNLGWIFQNGEDGVKRDHKEAINWYQKSSETGYPDAMFMLACYLYGEYGNVVPTDKNEAWRLYSEAAIHGSAYAMAAIADYYNGYLYGEETPESSNVEGKVMWAGRALAASPGSTLLQNTINKDIIKALINKGMIDQESVDHIIAEQAAHYILP